MLRLTTFLMKCKDAYNDLPMELWQRFEDASRSFVQRRCEKAAEFVNQLKFDGLQKNRKEVQAAIDLFSSSSLSTRENRDRISKGTDMMHLMSFLTKYNAIHNVHPKALSKSFEDAARTFIEQRSRKAVEFMHNLDDKIHSEKEVRTVINMFPSSLSYSNGILPIQTAALNIHSITFIPLLAKEGARLSIGDERGGLTRQFQSGEHSGRNPIQILTNSGVADLDVNGDQNAVDAKRLDTLQKLRSHYLFLESDITKLHLLCHYCYCQSKLRFQYLSDWDPDSLAESRRNTAPLIHYVTTRSKFGYNKTSFAMVLKAGIKHFPKKAGFLFDKNRGTTAFEAAVAKFGKDGVMSSIKQSLPSDFPFPIMHHLIRFAPDLVGEMAALFPEASGRRDPLTGLYSFVLAANSNSQTPLKLGIENAFTLLCRDPGLVQPTFVEGYNADIYRRKKRCLDLLYS